MKQVSKRDFMEICRLQGALTIFDMIVEHGIKAVSEIMSSFNNDLSDKVIECGLATTEELYVIDLNEIVDRALVVDKVSTNGLEMEITSFAKFIHDKAATQCIENFIQTLDYVVTGQIDLEVLIESLGERYSELADEYNEVMSDIEIKTGLDTFKDSDIRVIQ